MIFEKIIGIGACDEAGIMGKEGKLPWHCPKDLKHFSNTTLDCPIIMGRHTFQSLPAHYLKDRTAIIFTRHPLRLIPKKTQKLASGRVQSAENRFPRRGSYCQYKPPSRESISRQLSIPPPGQLLSLFGYNCPSNQIVVSSLREFFAIEGRFSTLYVIGGAQIYTLFLRENLIQEFILTRINGLYSGDTVFPLSLLKGWPNCRVEETPTFSIHRYAYPCYNYPHKT